MIEYAEQAIALAVQLEVGHPQPYTEEEVAGVKRLIVHAAKDLSELASFPQVVELDLFASEGRIPAGLVGVKRLRVSCSRVGGADFVAGMPLLEEAELAFSDVRSLAPILAHPTLHRGMLIGLPLSERSWTEERSALLHRVMPDGRRAAWMFSLDEDHALTMAMQGRGVDLCFGHMDARFPLLVRPGAPASKRIGVDYVLATPAAVREQLDDSGDDTATFLKRVIRAVMGRSPRQASNVRPARGIGDSVEALWWIETSKAPDEVKAALASLVHRFRGLTFFRESPGMSSLDQQRHRARLPAWLVASRGTVAGVSPHLRERDVGWILDGVDALFPGINGQGEQRFALGLFGAFAPEHQRVLEQGWFCVGYRTEGRPMVLVAKLADDLDKRVYVYDPTTVVNGALPHPPAPIFPTWGALLDRVVAIDLPDDGRIVGG
ncbi:MAG: hypothetical protein JXX28_17640 [Deltaproteobacteria bacterium]|nr:hypothetical protein [Deltaproteobacteria bacterium]